MAKHVANKPRKSRHFVYDKEKDKLVLQAELEGKQVDPATLPPRLRKQFEEFMKQYGNKRKPA